MVNNSSNYVYTSVPDVIESLYNSSWDIESSYLIEFSKKINSHWGEADSGYKYNLRYTGFSDEYGSIVSATVIRVDEDSNSQSLQLASNGIISFTENNICINTDGQFKYKIPNSNIYIYLRDGNFNQFALVLSIEINSGSKDEGVIASNIYEAINDSYISSLELRVGDSVTGNINDLRHSGTFSYLLSEVKLVSEAIKRIKADIFSLPADLGLSHKECAQDVMEMIGETVLDAIETARTEFLDDLDGFII